jgi:hypothetical protein
VPEDETVRRRQQSPLIPRQSDRPFNARLSAPRAGEILPDSVEERQLLFGFSKEDSRKDVKDQKDPKVADFDSQTRNGDANVQKPLLHHGFHDP